MSFVIPKVFRKQSQNSIFSNTLILANNQTVSFLSTSVFKFSSNFSCYLNTKNLKLLEGPLDFNLFFIAKFVASFTKEESRLSPIVKAH